MKTHSNHDYVDKRCQCGKIVAQSLGKKLYIKCRHCKRFVILASIEGEKCWKVQFKY